MGAIIYETINLHNKNKGLFPFKYIGSDQHNKPNYFGSNKQLLVDIKLLGKENFRKRIVCEFGNISNILLRKLESKVQQLLNAASKKEYYNRTNSSLHGYVETKEDKKIRMDKTHAGHKKWWNNLSDEEKEIYRNQARDNRKKATLKLSRTMQDIKTNMIFKSMNEARRYYKIKNHYNLLKLVKNNILKFI